jgi:hypothetical protein
LARFISNVLVLTIWLLFIVNCSRTYVSFYDCVNTDDLKEYEYCIDELLNTLHNSDIGWQRRSAAEQLGYFSVNKKPGAREILLKKAVPGLITAYSNEVDDLVRPHIVCALSEIKPANDDVIPIYLKAVEKGWDLSLEALCGIHGLKYMDYDLSNYVGEMIDNIISGNRERVKYGFTALKAMGRYAYSAIPLLEEIWDNDPVKHPESRREIDKTINIIMDDYDKYKEQNLEKEG